MTAWLPSHFEDEQINGERPSHRQDGVQSLRRRRPSHLCSKLVHLQRGIASRGRRPIDRLQITFTHVRTEAVRGRRPVCVCRKLNKLAEAGCIPDRQPTIKRRMSPVNYALIPGGHHADVMINASGNKKLCCRRIVYNQAKRSAKQRL